MYIPFNKPFSTGNELKYIQQAIDNKHLAGNGLFTKKCQSWLENHIGSTRAFLTHSCTAALEMAAILADVAPGDEIIMPSFTFVSTANAFVLRGAKPVFVDIHPDTFNIDETLIEPAITPQTKVIVPVHYAGVSCHMEKIMKIAEEHSLIVVEDAAQGVCATSGSGPVGSKGHMAAFSFHETKNVIAGEAGALLINDPRFVDRAAIVWEKGTNRQEFFLGLTDKYTWKDIGSSFVPSEITAAFLWAQLECAEEITAKRALVSIKYHQLFSELEQIGVLRRPVTPPDCTISAHVYYLLVNDAATRNELLHSLNRKDINAVFHYVPLHNSPAGVAFGRTCGSLLVTEDVSSRLIRLPLWAGISDEQIDRVCTAVKEYFYRSLGTLEIMSAAITG